MKKNPLSKFTDEELRKELMRREKRRKGPVLGYRAICYGDDYNYGGYSDYLKKDWKDAEERAKHLVVNSENGGYVEQIYKDTPKPGRIS